MNTNAKRPKRHSDFRNLSVDQAKLVGAWKHPVCSFARCFVVKSLSPAHFRVKNHATAMCINVSTCLKPTSHSRGRRCLPNFPVVTSVCLPFWPSKDRQKHHTKRRLASNQPQKVVTVEASKGATVGPLHKTAERNAQAHHWGCQNKMCLALDGMIPDCL